MRQPSRLPYCRISGTPWQSRLDAAGGLVRRFRRDERGMSAIVFGIMFAAVLLVGALAVDYGRAVTEYRREQSAIDAATFAASLEMGKPEQDTTGPERAKAVFAANAGKKSPSKLTSIKIDNTTGEVRGEASASVSSTLMKPFGHDSTSIATKSKVMRGNGTFEIALALDNTGSMAGSYIADLKAAANRLVDVVFAGADGSGKVKLGVVPFASSVNVGASYANSWWIDRQGASSAHFENFADRRNRFELLAAMGASWGGCVEQRPAPYDVTDDAPDASKGDSLFVPMFAPDEPDAGNAAAAGYSNYPNSYLDDFGGTCPAPEKVCASYNKRTGKCNQWQNKPIDVATAQSRSCKYDSAVISGGAGPNFNCTTPPLMRLGVKAADAHAAIDAMTANGYTNVAEGFTWGWRLLSPNAPFADGRKYGEPDNSKILVIMTDGENTYSAHSNHNKSFYGALGYAAKGRLGGSYTSSGYVSVVNTKLATACTNAKAKGVTVYAVGFRLGAGSTTMNLLRECASAKDKYFAAQDGDGLIQSFQNIGRSITALRLAE